MQVTKVMVTKVSGNDSVQGYASITLDELFVINGIRIMKNKQDELFVGYPSYKNKNGGYKDYCYPKDMNLREDIQIKVLAAFEQL